MKPLIDQEDRNQFIRGHARNISVIAPAGVGKTTSIVDRIVHIAKLTDGDKRLPRLIVVTYTSRAAQQMQQRARVAMREASVSPAVRRAFQQTFFGTIHSYCVRLLNRFGHYLGLPSPVGLVDNDVELWQRFLLRGLGRGISDDPHLTQLFHFYTPEKLYGLGRDLSPGKPIASRPMPALDLNPLLNFSAASLKGQTRSAVGKVQGKVLDWSKQWARGEYFRPLPDPGTANAPDFHELWRQTFLPLLDWLHDSARVFGRHVANDYAAFRLSEAVMSFDDQVRLALRVLDNEHARQELAEDRVSVLLDEAQDTDPLQFQVLQRVAGLGPDAAQADDQSFSIVGDFQQAIYAPRSDLETYRQVHNEITVEPRGAVSRLRVTFRCDAAIIAFANRIFPAVLDNQNGQSAFEPLVARTGAGQGRVLRWTCPDEPAPSEGGKISSSQRSLHEAKFLARRLSQITPAALGASNWSQVAILCPRVGWLRDLQGELIAHGVPTQLHSSGEKRGDRTPVAWLSALVWVAAHPEDRFEIAGVLREIFGISDSNMALFTDGDGDRLRLDRSAFTGKSEIERSLEILREACAGADKAPLSHALHRLLEKTRLRERLDLVAGPSDRELDGFLETLGARSAEGVTLDELAHEMKLGLAQKPQPEDEIRNAVQLLTAFKAKGLEWQAVIVPYVYRKISSKSPKYPRVVNGRGGEEIVCRDRADYNRLALPLDGDRDRQQFQRLYYVMATRPRHTLVWIDDEKLYAPIQTNSPEIPARFLEFDEVGRNRVAWLELPAEGPEVEAETTLPAKLRVELPALPDLSDRDVHEAIRKAEDFPRRFTPHELAVHVPHEAEPEKIAELEETEKAAAGPGVVYGTWWHEFVQTLPWAAPEQWQERFSLARKTAPDAKRAEKEWKLFLASELARELAVPGQLIQVELPFLWRHHDGRLLEGVMDMAVRRGDSWHVIDWKTNRVPKNGAAAIAENYRGQIEAYVGALRQMLSAEVRGSLYLTQTGALVPVVA